MPLLENIKLTLAVYLCLELRFWRLWPCLCWWANWWTIYDDIRVLHVRLALILSLIIAKQFKKNHEYPFLVFSLKFSWWANFNSFFITILVIYKEWWIDRNVLWSETIMVSKNSIAFIIILLTYKEWIKTFIGLTILWWARSW